MAKKAAPPLDSTATGVTPDADKAPTPSPVQSVYQFPTWWGGPAGSINPPRIGSDMQALRMAVGGLEARPSKEAYGPKFPVKSSKELFAKLAQALNDLGMVAMTVDQEVHHMDYSYLGKDGEPRQGTAIHVKARVRLGSSDGSYVDFVGSGHGIDKDDKAGGKASTYAWKDALLKGLTIGEKDLVDTDDDEGQGEASVSRKAAAAKPSTQVDYTAIINATKTVAELEAVKADMRKALSMEQQLALSTTYRSQLNKLQGEKA